MIEGQARKIEKLKVRLIALKEELTGSKDDEDDEDDETGHYDEKPPQEVEVEIDFVKLLESVGRVPTEADRAILAQLK